MKAKEKAGAYENKAKTISLGFCQGSWALIVAYNKFISGRKEVGRDVQSSEPASDKY